MVTDSRGRLHEPKGVPTGGRFASGNSGSGVTDDLPAPPVLEPSLYERTCRLSPGERSRVLRGMVRDSQRNGLISDRFKVRVSTGRGPDWRAYVTLTVPKGERRYAPSRREADECRAREGELAYLHADGRAMRAMIERCGGSASREQIDMMAADINRRLEEDPDSLSREDYECLVERPDVRAARRECERIAGQLTRDDSDPMHDYFDIDGIVTVDVVEDDEAAA